MKGIWALSLVDQSLFNKNPIEHRKHQAIKALNMFAKELSTDITKMHRIELQEGDMVDYADFTLPRQFKEVITKLPRSDLPKWVQDALCVLEVCEPYAIVPNVGMRINEEVFYLIKEDV